MAPGSAMRSTRSGSLAALILEKYGHIILGPDPKPAKRIRDELVFELFHDQYWHCLHCGKVNVSAAHVISRGAGGDDVMANLVPLCGGGSTGCHGAFDNGHSYIGDFGQKITPEAVKASIAAFIRSEEGEAHAAYLIAKLGPFGAEAWVQTRLEGRVRV